MEEMNLDGAIFQLQDRTRTGIFSSAIPSFSTFSRIAELGHRKYFVARRIFSMQIFLEIILLDLLFSFTINLPFFDTNEEETAEENVEDKKEEESKLVKEKPAESTDAEKTE